MSLRGLKRSEDTRKKMSESMIGKKNSLEEKYIKRDFTVYVDHVVENSSLEVLEVVYVRRVV